MASSRRTSPAQANRQQEWIQEPTEEVIMSNIKAQSCKQSLDEREVDRRRELSEITRRHLERVINTMIPSSGCSSVEPVDSALVNSLVTQPSEKDIEGLEFKQIPKEKEKQVIVNNYYIGDKENGWKQLVRGKIPPDISGDKTQGNYSQISPNKTLLEGFSEQSRIDRDTKNLNVDRDMRNSTQTKTEPMRFRLEEAEIQNMSPPPRYNPNYPPPARPTMNQENAAMLDCIRQLQLTIHQHILTNSKQAEYHMSQNVDLFMEMTKGQKRRDLGPAVMAIPMFTEQEPEKCLDWINRIKNICSQAGHSL